MKQQGKNQKQIEQEIKISQSAISQTLKNQNTIMVLETEELIQQYLSKFIE